MTNETNFFDLCGVVRDRYAAEIRRAKDQYNKRKKEIKENYKGALEKEENEKSKLRYVEAMETAADKAKKAIEEEFTKAEIREKAKVSAVLIGSEYVRALDNLQGVSISLEEFKLIADGCAGRGYWVESKLRKLAEENGIEKAPGLDAPFSEKMAALETAKSRMLEYIEKADIENPDFLITDKALRQLESDFSNGFTHYDMSAEKRAGLLLDKAKTCDTLPGVAVFIKNALETSTPEVCAEIVKAISKDSPYWESVKEYGLGAVLDKISKEESKSAKECLHLVYDARLAGAVSVLSEAERQAALYGSSIYPADGTQERKIDKQGLDFLKTEEGKRQIKRFELIEKKAAEHVAEKKAEAEERARLEGA